MTREKLEKILEEAMDKGEIAKLRYADLRDADLTSANLRDADLRIANLRDANLRDADLTSANLRDADLTSANLRGANLRSANLRNADLRDAKLRGADLRYTDLRSANLRNADLRDANIDFSCLPLCCESLQMHIDERQAKQLLYHVLSLVDYSKHISEETRKLLLTKELVNYANGFHRVGEVPKLEAESEVEQ